MPMLYRRNVFNLLVARLNTSQIQNAWEEHHSVIYSSVTASYFIYLANVDDLYNISKWHIHLFKQTRPMHHLEMIYSSGSRNNNNKKRKAHSSIKHITLDIDRCIVAKWYFHSHIFIFSTFKIRCLHQTFMCWQEGAGMPRVIWGSLDTPQSTHDMQLKNNYTRHLPLIWFWYSHFYYGVGCATTRVSKQRKTTGRKDSRIASDSYNF